jgi:MYXO-CTERM domain-containing protein
LPGPRTVPPQGEDPGAKASRLPASRGRLALPHRPPLPGRHAAFRLGEGLLTLAAGLAAAIPVIVATVKAVQAGWVPLADRGIIATRAHDVLTSHPPLVGQYTLAGEVTGKVTHSLGPMLFWLLALPARDGSTVGMTVTMGALNTLCILGCVALARRRSGRVLMAMVALAIALMCQSLAAETFHDVWNPSAGLFPFTLLVFLCWSLACGEYRLAPLAALVASFVAQTHLTYLPPTLALLGVGFGGLAAGWIRAPRPRRRTLLAWGLATLLVAAFCWSATVAGQLTEHPGNLTLVAEAATKHKATLGSRVGWHAVVHAVGIVPWWLHTPASRWQRKYEVRSTPSRLASDSTVALLAALGLVILAGLRRRRRDLLALALIALMLCPALAAVAAATPTPPLLSATLGYTMWWGSQVGMVVWLTLAWALWLALAWVARGVTRRVVRSPLPAARVAALGSVTLTLLAVAATAAVGEAVAAKGKPDEHAVLYRPVKAIDARLAQLIPRRGSVLLEGNLDGATMPVKPAVRYFLVTRGTRVLASGSSLRLGTWYELYDRPYREAIYLSDVPRPPVKHVKLVFQAGFREGSTLNTVYVWLSPRPGR